MGPNVKKLVAMKISLDAVPDGGGMPDVLRFLLDQERVAKSAKDAAEWARQAIAEVRSGAGPNPWKDATDEDIAGEIIRQVDAKKAARRGPGA